MLVDKEAQLF